MGDDLKTLLGMGCVATVTDEDGIMQPCSRPVVAVRHWPDYGDGESYGGVCESHAQGGNVKLAPLAGIPDPAPWPAALEYEDWTDGIEDPRPREGDYGIAGRDTALGDTEIPFHIEREPDTGLLVALLDDGLDAKPEDDFEDGRYTSLLQLYLDGYTLTRTGRRE